MKASIPCPHDSPNQRDLAPLYLAGRLTEEDAQAFEAHSFACPRCREDVSAGAALRELYGKPAVAASEAPGRARRPWLPLAAAAALALLAVGTWQIVRRPPEPSVLRGGVAEGALAVKIETGSPDSLRVSWSPRPEAAGYVVQVFASDGTSVWKSESREPRLAIDAAVLPERKDATLTIQVEAIDALGRVVASSDLVALPDR